PSIGKRTMLLNAREIPREGGRETLILLAIEDATERIKAQEMLRDNEERFRSLVKDLPAGVYSCDSDGTITYFNRAAAKLWGREPRLGVERWCGSWKMIGADGSRVHNDSCPMAIAIREGRPIIGEELTIEREDGTRSFVKVYPQPVVNLAGHVTGAINMVLDVTEQRIATDNLKSSEEMLRTLALDLEKTVVERTAELMMANRSLQGKNTLLLRLNKE